MSRGAWVCLTSSCTGALRITSTEHAKTEGRWQVLATCVDCCRLHRATKHGIALLGVALPVVAQCPSAPVSTST